MKISSPLFFISIIALSLLASGGLTLSKFYVAKNINFQSNLENTAETEGVTSDNFVILSPDEITYATWLQLRPGSFVKFIDGDSGVTLNVFGFFVGGINYLFDSDWHYLFLIGIVGFIFFISSLKRLLHCLSFRKKTVAIGVAAICLSPTVINLSSGFLRDLYMLSFLNLSLVALIRKQKISFVVFTLFVMALRTFIPIVLLPIYTYFVCKKFHIYQRQFLVFVAFLTSLLILITGLLIQGKFYTTSTEAILREVALRFICGVSGINVVVLKFHELFDDPGAAMVEKLSLTYQFFVMCALYILIAKSRMKLHTFFLPFLYSTISLSIIYAMYIGFFVARTKLILLVFAVIYISFHLEQAEKRRVIFCKNDEVGHKVICKED